jgi:hypothetical protein
MPDTTRTQSHRFQAGDLVMLLDNDPTQGAQPGIYRIVRPLPVTDRGLQYRARRDGDDFDVVLNEAPLTLKSAAD